MNASTTKEHEGLHKQTPFLVFLRVSFVSFLVNEVRGRQA
jgi:hypothetical protein